MNKNRDKKRITYWWFLPLLLFIAVTCVSSFLRFRLDLTAEKRFSLSQPTKTLLQALDSSIQIKVFLTGDLPPDYRKLSLATQDLLAEFREISNNQIQIEFENPGADLPDSLRYALYDSLSGLGVVFQQNEDFSETENRSTQQLIIPSALCLVWK